MTYSAQVGVDAPGAGLPGGTVSFVGNNGPIAGCTAVPLSLGAPDVATCTTTYTGVTVDSVSASYSGDANFLGASSVALMETVRPALTDTTLVATPDPAVAGRPVALRAKVLVIAPGAGIASGAVTFTDGSATLCSAVSLDTTGSATCQVTYPVISTSPHLVSATYTGSANDLASRSNTVNLSVTQATHLKIMVTPPNTTYGHKVMLHAAGLPPHATGTVTFSVGSTLICQLVLQGPGGDCTPNEPFAPGNYTITGLYSGDHTFAPSSDSASLVVSLAHTNIHASVAPHDSPYGAVVTATAKDIPTGATGTVSFAVSGTTVCTLPAASPSVSCTLPGPLGVGNHDLSVNYTGDANFVGSSDTTKFSVHKAAAPFVALASPPTIAAGDALTLSASQLPAAATGSVSFSAGHTVFCVAPVINGTASCGASTAGLDAHTYHVTAKYSGDADFNPSNAPASFVVAPGASGPKPV